MILVCLQINPLTPNSAKSKIDKFSKITNWVKLKKKQHCRKVLINSFPMNGHRESEVRKFCTTHSSTVGV